jgi:hypothetical protein
MGGYLMLLDSMLFILGSPEGLLSPNLKLADRDCEGHRDGRGEVRRKEINKGKNDNS